jgi:hypothetical protein
VKSSKKKSKSSSVQKVKAVSPRSSPPSSPEVRAKVAPRVHNAVRASDDDVVVIEPSILISSSPVRRATVGYNRYDQIHSNSNSGGSGGGCGGGGGGGGRGRGGAAVATPPARSAIRPPGKSFVRPPSKSNSKNRGNRSNSSKSKSRKNRVILIE